MKALQEISKKWNQTLTQIIYVISFLFNKFFIFLEIPKNLPFLLVVAY
jgi:hypothetical protein